MPFDLGGSIPGASVWAYSLLNDDLSAATSTFNDNISAALGQILASAASWFEPRTCLLTLGGSIPGARLWAYSLLSDDLSAALGIFSVG